ncbi:MAG: efflux RND transporter periplasmic adaptor subunit [Desulfomonile tiedjei]|nr:efflux RND transporter periplasmic adaptor subunit [Desulfomonile tiedjei]
MVLQKKKILVAAICLAGLILALVWVQGGFHSKVPGGTTPVPPGQPSAAKTVPAETVRTTGDVTVSGTVSSRETARVASRVLGYVVELNVDVGAQVQKGQVLLRIDTKELAEKEAQAKAALESAKADLVKARNDFERYKILFEKESVAKKDYDDMLARFETAQAAEQRASAALDEAKTMLSYGVVTAPFDGIVSDRSVNVGDLATPGRALMSVYMPGTLELVAPVGEQYAPYLDVGKAVTVAVPSVNLKQESSIREIVPQRDERTRTVTVKAPLSQSSGLGPGLYGTLTFRTRSSDVIVIPKRAVNVVGQLETVRVSDNGVVRIRNVKTGRVLSDDKVEILSGLNAGEKVVVD